MHGSTSKRFNPLSASLAILTLSAAVVACGSDHGGSARTTTSSIRPTTEIPATPVGDRCVGF